MLVPQSSKSALEESLDFSPIEQKGGINPINTILPDYDTLPTLFAPTFLSCNGFLLLSLKCLSSRSSTSLFIFIGLWDILELNSK